MAKYTTPGVYIDELHLNLPNIDAVPAGIPAFIGHTALANENAENDLLQIPKLIGSVTDYKKFYGMSGEAPACAIMHESVAIYFKNGGESCYIIAAGICNDQQSSSARRQAIEQALSKAESVSGIGLLVFPGAMFLTSADDYYAICVAAMQQCAAVGNRFVLLDIYRNSKDLESDIRALRSALPGDTTLLRNAAAYAPGIIVSTGITAKRITLPSAPAIAGVFVQIDKTKGIWKAPANINIAGVSGLEEMINDKEQELLNVDTAGGKSVNAIRSFAGKGNAIIWGARTLAGNDNEWRYISVRRFVMMIEASVKNGLQQFAFEPNDNNTWARLRQAVENFLVLSWKNGALQGSSTNQAFYVRCGLGATMTNLDILEGRLIAEIGLAVIRPAEFIVLRFTQQAQTP